MAKYACLTFDDGCVGIMPYVYPAFLARGIAGTLYLNAVRIEVYHDMSVADCDALYAARWDISDHTYSHVGLAEGNPIPDPSVLTDITAMEAYLLAHSWTRGMGHFSYAGTAVALSSNEYAADLAVLGMKTARRGGRTPAPTLTNLLLMEGHSDGATVAERKTLIDNLVDEGAPLFFYGHDYCADNETPGNNMTARIGELLEVVDYGIAHGVTFLPVSAWYAHLQAHPPATAPMYGRVVPSAHTSGSRTWYYPDATFRTALEADPTNGPYFKAQRYHSKSYMTLPWPE